MSCEKQISGKSSDFLEVYEGKTRFDASGTAWLVGQGIRFLNMADKESENSYQHVVELLRRCSKDLIKVVNEFCRQEDAGDAPLRWNLLYLLGDAGDAAAADFLLRAALKQLPEARDGHGCESSQDAEILVSTMAVHALQRVAARHSEAGEYLLKIVSARPVRPILIEAVKAANELGLKDKVRDILPPEDHWILDIRQARIQEVIADPERKDGKERGFTPPKTGSLYTAPKLGCSIQKEK